jgi:hypothetical protein
VHATRQDAVRWVHDNTDNVVFATPSGYRVHTTIRVDAGGTLWELMESTVDQGWYWARMNRLSD